MVHFLLILLTGVLTSLYLFPFEFMFFPGVNTKMMLAAIGLVSLFFQLGKQQNAVLSKGVFIISVFACIVSLVGLVSVTLNGTSDFAYATYVASMWTWLGGAYALYLWMRSVHQNVPWWLICNYLIAVCFAQCVLALMIEYIPSVKTVVNAYIGSMGGMGDASMFDDRGRLYGIGAAVDVAGTRFAAVSAMIAYLCFNLDTERLKRWLLPYLFAFFFIAVVGNMIARTTTAGIVVAFLYCVYASIKGNALNRENILRFWKCFSVLLLVFIPVVYVCYRVSPELRENIRFGFEGFFSLVEQGKWETNSNNVLKGMYRFPETLKTWVIGDGYFDNPMGDPYYMGYHWKGFYMGTDVGYLRFIFYFGLLGFTAFSAFFLKTFGVCISKYEKQKELFVLLLLMQIIVWFKVSTDLFVIFALFLALDSSTKQDEEEYNKPLET